MDCSTNLSVNLGSGVDLIQITDTAYALWDRSQAVIFKLKAHQLEKLQQFTMSMKRIKLTDYKTITISVYQGKIYFHLKDAGREKSFTLSQPELKAVVKAAPKMLKYGKQLLKEDKSRKKNRKDKAKRRNTKSKLDSSDDDIEMSSCEESGGEATE